MPVTILIENRKPIYRNGEFIGKEYAAKTIESKIEYSLRKTIIPIIDHVIDNAYWLFMEAKKYGVITSLNNRKFEYLGNQYDMWDLIDKISRCETVFSGIETRISEKEVQIK